MKVLLLVFAMVVYAAAYPEELQRERRGIIGPAPLLSTISIVKPAAVLAPAPIAIAAPIAVGSPIGLGGPLGLRGLPLIKTLG